MKKRKEFEQKHDLTLFSNDFDKNPLLRLSDQYMRYPERIQKQAQDEL